MQVFPGNLYHFICNLDSRHTNLKQKAENSYLATHNTNFNWDYNSLIYHVYNLNIKMSGAHRGQKRGFDSLELGVTDSYELSCGSWESNSSPLQEPSVLLTAELTLQING